MIEIYYEDSDIVVCEKPYGVSSQLSSGENMISLLSAQLNSEIFPVHRLDTTTTGLMVFAKNDKGAKMLSEDMSKHLIVKEYFAVCHGEMEDSAKLTDFLYHDKIQNKSFVVKTKRKGAKEAILNFWTQGKVKTENGEILSLVRIRLETGRTHQIRVQLSSRGNTLYGDGKYGAKDNDKIALHSSYLKFYHPITKKEMEFSSKPKGEIWELFD